MTETRKTERLWDRALSALERGRMELTKISRVGKLKLDLAQLQRTRKTLLKKLGEDTYRLLKENRFESSEVQKHVAILDELEDSIRKLQARIDTAAKQAADKTGD